MQMTTQQTAQALMDEVKREHPTLSDYALAVFAAQRAIEQHEAFKQKVSDAVDYYNTSLITGTLEDISQAEQDLLSFIIPAPKPDPLVEAWIEATGNTVGMEPLNAALEARGLEIRSKNDE